MEELTGGIQTGEKDLAHARTISKKEAVDFTATEAKMAAVQQQLLTILCTVRQLKGWQMPPQCMGSQWVGT